MNIRTCSIVLAVIAGIFSLSFQVGAQIGVNSVEGFIYDDSRDPVYNAYVELYNEIGTLVDRQRSSNSGRFIFRGMPAGRYTITVKPYGTNLQEDTKDFEIVTTFNRSDSIHLDFHLRMDRRFTQQEQAIVGTVYAQDVPEQARNLFKEALDDLKNHKDQKAIGELEEALKIFPTYFDALASLGKKLILTGSYEKGYPFLLRAIDINSRCADCYYTLGIAFYKIDQFPAAIKAAEASIVLQPDAPGNRLLLGMVLRLNGDLSKAEKVLLTAKSLYKEPNPEVHWQLSLVYNKENRNSEAADELEQYLKAKPDISDADKQGVRDLIAKLRKSKQS